MSSANRCRRAISNATSPTSQGRDGTWRGRSMRPTWSTYTVLAPSSRARPMGMLWTRPPSKKCSSPTRTGGSSPGTAAEASTAGTIGPAMNQWAAARSMLAATHWNGRASSSMRCTGRPSSSARRGSLGCRWVPERARVRTRPNSDPPNASAATPSRHTAASSGTAAPGSRWAATNTPLSAPTEVPSTRSGRTPASARAWSMPTSWAPSTPPPPSTKATSRARPWSPATVPPSVRTMIPQRPTRDGALVTFGATRARLRRGTRKAGGRLQGLRIAVLGKPRITREDGSPVELGSAKATALLLYLATTGERHSRSALAGLLWGDLPEEGARANLRLALTKLRRVADDNLQVTRGHVAADPSSFWLDRREFAAALAGGDGDLERVKAAVRLYRGDFLDDLVVRGAPELETWIEGEREHLRRLAVTGLARLADDAAARGDPAAGVEAARRMLSLDPLSEEAHRLLMGFLAAKDDRAAALAQFETCRHVLAEELGVDPSPETIRLTDRIRAGDLAPTRPDPGVPEPAPPGLGPPEGERSRVGNGVLPVVHTPDLIGREADLIGREADLARVVELVEGEACRLLTLVGPGGVGKTRLCLAAAEGLAPRFADGAAVVALAGVEPDNPEQVPDLLAVTVAEALAVPLAARRPVRDLLKAWLAERRLLVVLDNLEHLPGAASLFTDLLAGAPGLKLLATSRRRVGAGVEWVLDVPGLGEGPAVELFAERARRVRAGFSLEEEGPAVAAICRLVEGLPLAIELAADLARTLPCQVIADKLGSDLDVLQTTSAARPPRHRSMRAVIEASWRLLDGDQQRALARLSVFRGGFDPAAAEAVAGAEVAMLSALVERSLVDRAEGGRYGLHELLRQFAAERLEAAGYAAATRRAHAAHYAGFLRSRHDRLADAFDAAVLAEVDPETGNLRAAWQELAEADGIDALAGLLEDLWLVHRRHGRFEEALGAIQRALAREDATPRQRARWHLWAGLAQYQLGRSEEGQEELRAMLALAHRPLPAPGPGP